MMDNTPYQVEMFAQPKSAPAKVAANLRPGSRFGSKVRALRKHQGLSQRALAERLGVSPAYLSQLESGKKGRPSDRLIHAICHQFGLIWDDADDLFTLADSSRRVVKIDASRMDETKTEVARLFAEKLPSMKKAQLLELMDLLES